MKFKRAMPLWVQPSIIVLYFMFSFLVLFGMTYENWINVGVGSLSLTLLTVGTVFIYKSATYVLTEDYLHIKGINNGFKVDKKISYRDILNLATYTYNKVNQLRITFWAEKKAEYIDIPLPYPVRTKVFLDRIETEMRKHDFSHIISPEHFDGLDNISIKQEEVSFMDYCQLNSNMMIALLQDNERVILLWYCWLYEKEEFVNTSPPETVNKKYVSCPIMNVRHLEYKTVDEALSDTKWNDSLKKEVREIDVIAYNSSRDMGVNGSVW